MLFESVLFLLIQTFSAEGGFECIKITFALFHEHLLSHFFSNKHPK